MRQNENPQEFDQFANHEPEELETSENNVLQLFQELRRCDRGDIRSAVRAIGVFVGAERLAEMEPHENENYSTKLLAAYRSSRTLLAGKATVAQIYESYETLLEMTSQYVYCFHETFPSPLGHERGIADMVEQQIVEICGHLGLVAYANEKLANHWRKQSATSLSSIWIGAESTGSETSQDVLPMPITKSSRWIDALAGAVAVSGGVLLEVTCASQDPWRHFVGVLALLMVAAPVWKIATRYAQRRALVPATQTTR